MNWLRRLQHYLCPKALGLTIAGDWNEEEEAEIFEIIGTALGASRPLRLTQAAPDVYTITAGPFGATFKYQYFTPYLFWNKENYQPDFHYVSWGFSRARNHHWRSLNWASWWQELGVATRAEVAKTKFCAFLYWNAFCPTRNRFYDLLSQYRRVDALGLVMRNTHSATPGRFVGPRDTNAASAYRPYKFVISFENSIGEHYISEKILTTYAGGAVPIYWGSPHIAQYYNPESFINAYDFDSLESLTDYVIKVDRDERLYERYRTAPIYTESQRQRFLQGRLHKDAFLLKLYDDLATGCILPMSQRQNLHRELLSLLAGHSLRYIVTQIHHAALARSARGGIWPFR